MLARPSSPASIELDVGAGPLESPRLATGIIIVFPCLTLQPEPVATRCSNTRMAQGGIERAEQSRILS